jgi:hypothetical protein
MDGAAYISSPNMQYNEGGVVYAPKPEVGTLNLAGKRVKLKLINELPDDTMQLAAIDRSNLARKLGAIIVSEDYSGEQGYIMCEHYVVPESTHEQTSYYHNNGWDSQSHDKTQTVEIALRLEYWENGELKYTVNRSRSMAVNVERYRSSGTYQEYWFWDRDVSRYTTYDTFSLEKGLLDGMRQLWGDFFL